MIGKHIQTFQFSPSGLLWFKIIPTYCWHSRLLQNHSNIFRPLGLLGFKIYHWPSPSGPHSPSHLLGFKIYHWPYGLTLTLGSKVDPRVWPSPSGPCWPLRLLGFKIIPSYILKGLTLTHTSRVKGRPEGLTLTLRSMLTLTSTWVQNHSIILHINIYHGHR